MAHALEGRRILVARARGQASALADALAAAGAEPVFIPAIELVPPESYERLDHALRTIETFDWLVLTSANAVAMITARATQLHLTLRPRRVAAIGPATAAAAAGAGWPVQLIPAQFVAESFADALLPYAAASRMLLVRAAQARDVLPDRLRAAGAEVMIAEAYRTIVPEASAQRLQALLAGDTAKPRERLDAILFTSASTASNLAALIKQANAALPPGIVLASIGPITSAAMREAALPPTVEASTSTIAGLVEAVVQHYNRHPSV